MLTKYQCTDNHTSYFDTQILICTDTSSIFQYQHLSNSQNFYFLKMLWNLWLLGKKPLILGTRPIFKDKYWGVNSNSKDECSYDVQKFKYIQSLEKVSHFLVFYHYPRYSSTDHWMQESIKRIFSSGMFWAVGAAEKKKAKLP